MYTAINEADCSLPLIKALMAEPMYSTSHFPSFRDWALYSHLSCFLSNMVSQGNEACADRLSVAVAVCLPREFKFQPNSQRNRSLTHNVKPTNFRKVITG